MWSLRHPRRCWVVQVSPSSGQSHTLCPVALLVLGNVHSSLRWKTATTLTVTLSALLFVCCEILRDKNERTYAVILACSVGSPSAAVHSVYGGIRAYSEDHSASVRYTWMQPFSHYTGIFTARKSRKLTLLSPVHTSNNGEATLSKQQATLLPVASTMLPFLATKSNVASTLLLVWTGL